MENPQQSPTMDAVRAIDPLGELPAVSNMLPRTDLFPKKTAEPGSSPLRNRKREAFCEALTGWGGDGRRIENCKAYEIAYGKGGSTARSESTHLLAVPEVAERVAWLEKRVHEAKRHDYLAAQQGIDELRLGIIERAKQNSKLAGIALVAARDFEKAHGLDQTAQTSTVEETAEVTGAQEVLPGLLATIRKVVRTTRTGSQP